MKCGLAWFGCVFVFLQKRSYPIETNKELVSDIDDAKCLVSAGCDMFEIIGHCTLDMMSPLPVNWFEKQSLCNRRAIRWAGLVVKMRSFS